MIHESGTFQGWIPTDFLDETVPPRRPTPDDWLVRGDVLRLASRQEAFEDPRSAYDDDDPDLIGARVTDGQVVGFVGLTQFRTVRLRWLGEGRHELLTSVPEAATQFWLRGDMDTMAYGLSEFVAQNDFDIDEIVEVECYDWTERLFVLTGAAFVPWAGDAPAGTA